jgi:hypothetical protein
MHAFDTFYVTLVYAGCVICIVQHNVEVFLFWLRELMEIMGVGGPDIPRESEGQLSKATEDVRAQRAASPASKEHEEEELVQGVEEHQVLPNH